MTRIEEAKAWLCVFLAEDDPTLTDEGAVLRWLLISRTADQMFHTYAVICESMRVPFTRELVQKRDWNVPKLLASNLWVQLSDQRRQV